MADDYFPLRPMLSARTTEYMGADNDEGPLLTHGESTSNSRHQPTTSSRKSFRSHKSNDSHVSYDIANEFEYFDEERNFSPDFKRNLSAVSTQYSNGSSSISPHEAQFAIGKPGWWVHQMLVDRSLRMMAGVTFICAIIMWIICFVYTPAFIHRLNLHSTSVGGKDGESCATMEKRNVAVHFFINIAATMVLGCSNTFQQLVTALKADEIKWALSRHGDARVGTNSPFAINNKKSGKLKAWLSWLLLITTSLPIHFLANSIIGPSLYVTPPTHVIYNQTTQVAPINNEYDYQNSLDGGCWAAYRSGSYAYPPNFQYLDQDYQESEGYSTVAVTYVSGCAEYANQTTPDTAFKELDAGGDVFRIDSCMLGYNVTCELQDPLAETCRLNVRMQAAFTLAGCLLIKACYMIATLYKGRGRVKQQCLTYGDVIVAAVMNPDIQVKNECLLNAGEGFRTQVSHSCHKHCKDPELSETGDGIGHCQKCKKFNITNKAANLPHPAVAIKYKKSLIGNLGSTALTQMTILILTTFAMVGSSIVIITVMASAKSELKEECRDNSGVWNTFDGSDNWCKLGLAAYLKNEVGTFGGFNSSASLANLPADSLASEYTAFAISNGAQFLFSLLYLLLIYNITLISMEHDWGKFETHRRRLRSTIVQSPEFEQSYFLQLPRNVLFPLMALAATMHWLLGQAISTIEKTWSDPKHGVEHSMYTVVTAAYPIFLSTALMISMTSVCWWAFTYKREGFAPQMYGSIRACCASTTNLHHFTRKGVQWGDLGGEKLFRHAGFSHLEVGKIIAGELYCGDGVVERKGKDE